MKLSIVTYIIFTQHRVVYLALKIVILYKHVCTNPFIDIWSAQCRGQTYLDKMHSSEAEKLVPTKSTSFSQRSKRKYEHTDEGNATLKTMTKFTADSSGLWRCHGDSTTQYSIRHLEQCCSVGKNVIFLQQEICGTKWFIL